MTPVIRRKFGQGLIAIGLLAACIFDKPDQDCATAQPTNNTVKPNQEIMWRNYDRYAITNNLPCAVTTLIGLILVSKKQK